jgi:beta-lactamase regulating signal transducer with metallopeptidase domain
MIIFAQWITPATMRVLALALLHFLWQGAALAALAYLVMSLCRSASARYLAGVGIMVLMLAAPVITFLAVQSPEQADSSTQLAAVAPFAARSGANFIAAATKHSPAGPSNSPAYFLWLVEVWFAGVVMLSLRSVGGFLLVERLRRKESTPVSDRLLDLCRSLQTRMGVTRAVRYCQSVQLDAPAVAGWIRPVVLLPVTALTGLSEMQLEAVIAHELAHIRRCDAFVNLFQVAVETLLFYHPAVWWLGKRIRTERENCCDDAAVALCGSPVTYAHALARMAEWKAAPQLAMAANRKPLVERVTRLLGANQSSDSLRGANLSAGVLCLSFALLAGSAFLGNARKAQAQAPAPASPAASLTVASPTRTPNDREAVIVVRADDSEAAPAPAAPEGGSATTTPAPAPPQATPPASGAKQSYIDSLKDAGLTNLTVDELIGLKVQGVTGEYVKRMKDLGLKVGPDELIGMKVQGITPEYVQQMRAATGQTLNSDELIGMKVQGVTPEYVRQIHELGFKTEADEVIGMKVQGVTPEYVRELRGLGLKLDSDDVIGMKVQGVTPEYVKSFQDLGLHPGSDEIIGMRVQGITAAYVKELQAAGFKVDIDEAIGAKVQGITLEYIAKARSHGFKDLTLEKLIALKHTGVLDAGK